MRTQVGDHVLVGYHGDGSPRYGTVTAIINDNGDAPPWLRPLASRVVLDPEPYVPAEVAPGVWTLDTLCLGR